MTTYDDPFTFENSTVALVIERITRINRKVTPQDCQTSTTLRSVAEWYAKQYNGIFPFMVSMRSAMQTRGTLSPAQISGTLNCMMNDYHYQQHRIETQRAFDNERKPFVMPSADLPSDLGNRQLDAETPTPDASVTPVCLNGTYTIVLDEAGDYRTLRLVDCPEHFNKPAGTQIAQYLSGDDNESNYTGFAFIFGSEIKIWSKFLTSKPNPNVDSKIAKALQVLLGSDRQGQIDLGEAYALKSGNCFHCGRKLTVPTSVARGLGPICAGKFDL